MDELLTELLILLDECQTKEERDRLLLHALECARDGKTMMAP